MYKKTLFGFMVEAFVIILSTAGSSKANIMDAPKVVAAENALNCN